MRFVFTVVPGLMICAVGLLFWPIQAVPDPQLQTRLRTAGTRALVAITLLAVPFGIANATQHINAGFADIPKLKLRTDAIQKHVPAGSLLFCNDARLLHHIQINGDYFLYEQETFDKATLTSMPDRVKRDDNASPVTIDPGRVNYLLQLTKNKTQVDLDAMRDQIIIEALKAGRRVFVFREPGTNRAPWQPFTSSNLLLIPVLTGDDNSSQTAGNANLASRPASQWKLDEVISKDH
jgi:hypothetical protein